MRVVIVGAGALGTMHAWHAVARGHEVVHLEREREARGASVRNFGLVWVGGRAAGPELRTALRARELWQEIGARVPGVGFRPGGSLTAVRSEAERAVAEEVLARPDAGDLAILGSGAQARAHLEAMAEVRPVRRVRVWSRTAANAEAFAVWARQLLPGVEVEAAATVSAALAGADLVCTTTASHEPLVEAADLAPGAHVNAVGASVADARELTSAAVARCAIYVDSKESAANEAGDLRAPLAEGLIDAGRIRGELGEVLLGRAEGRRDEREITLYKSLGLAVQDVAAGFAALRGATERGLGTDVPFPG